MVVRHPLQPGPPARNSRLLRRSQALPSPLAAPRSRPGRIIPGSGGRPRPGLPARPSTPRPGPLCRPGRPGTPRPDAPQPAPAVPGSSGRCRLPSSASRSTSPPGWMARRGWLAQIDRSQRRSILALILTRLAVGVGAAALYISLTRNADSDRSTLSRPGSKCLKRRRASRRPILQPKSPRPAPPSRNRGDHARHRRDPS